MGEVERSSNRQSQTFSSDVFAVCEFENVLLAVNHLNRAVLKDLKAVSE